MCKCAVFKCGTCQGCNVVYNVLVYVRIYTLCNILLC